MANKILTVSELAEHLNVHRITIYRLLKSGNLPGFKIGRVWRFDLDEITSWMTSGKSAQDMNGADGIAQRDGHPQGDGHLPRDGKLHSDGHLSHDGHLKSARPQVRTQPPTRGFNKEPREGNKPRR